MRFVTYAIDCRLSGGPNDPVKLAQTGVEVSPQPFIEIDEGWTHWLGTFYAKHFRDAKLHLLAFDPDNDLRDQNATQRIGNVYQSLWLHGLLAVDRAEAVHGPYVPDEPLRADGTLHLHTPSWEAGAMNWPCLNSTTLDSVDRVATGLGTRNRRGKEFRRVWHGLHMLLRGLQEQFDGFERSACLIRSLEAIVFASTERTGAREFGRRMARLAAAADLESDLSAAYDQLRNGAIHLRDRQMIEKNANIKERLAALGQLAESLTLHVWREILGRPEVLESASDERLPELQRQLKAGETKNWLGARFGQAPPLTPALAVLPSVPTAENSL